MKTDPTTPTTIDEYIAGFPPEVQEILEKIRTTIRAAAPDAAEAIKYQIPTFTLYFRLTEGHFRAKETDLAQLARRFLGHSAWLTAPTGG